MKRQTLFINSGPKSIRLKLQKNFNNRFYTLLFDIVFNKHSLQLTWNIKCSLHFALFVSGPSTPDPVNPNSRNVPEKPPISLMINRESNQVLVGFPRYSRALFLAPGQLLPARAYIVTVTVEGRSYRGALRMW